MLALKYNTSQSFSIRLGVIVSSGTFTDLDLAIILVRRLGEEAEARIRIICSILSDQELGEDVKLTQATEVWRLIGIDNVNININHTLAISFVALRSVIIANLDFKPNDKVMARGERHIAGVYTWTKVQDMYGKVQLLNPFGNPIYLDPIKFTFIKLGK